MKAKRVEAWYIQDNATVVLEMADGTHEVFVALNGYNMGRKGEAMSANPFFKEVTARALLAVVDAKNKENEK